MPKKRERFISRKLNKSRLKVNINNTEEISTRKIVNDAQDSVFFYFFKISKLLNLNSRTFHFKNPNK